MNNSKPFAFVLTTIIVASGSAFAASAPNPKIGGVDVVDGSLTGIDVQDNSLTGVDIDESTLSGNQITGVNAATLNGQTSSTFATIAALTTLTARVSVLESTISKLNGASALTISDLVGTYNGNGYQSELRTTPVINPATGLIVNYQPHFDLHTESVTLAVNSDGTFAVTHPPGCEQGVQWNGGSPVTTFVGAGCDDVTTGTVEIVGNGSTINLWIAGASAPIEVHTAAGGRVATLSVANDADGAVTIIVFTKQN